MDRDLYKLCLELALQHITDHIANAQKVNDWETISNREFEDIVKDLSEQLLLIAGPHGTFEVRMTW